MSQQKLKNNNAVFIDLLRLITSRFESETKPMRVLEAAVNYIVRELDRSHVYSVYKIRRDLQKRTSEHIAEFDCVLKNLSAHHSERILVHMFKIDGGILIFFTSLDCKEMFGYISSSENGEGFAENQIV